MIDLIAIGGMIFFAGLGMFILFVMSGTTCVKLPGERGYLVDKFLNTIGMGSFWFALVGFIILIAGVILK